MIATTPTAAPKLKKKILDRRIPTLVGLAVLVIALISGTLLIGAPSMFAPRATPETTPTRTKITNVTDNSFTVSFVTAEKTAGFAKYGTDANSLKSQSGDDRDQLTGTVGTYNTHHVSVRGLEQNTTYHFVLGTGSGSTFDNNGSPFTVKTARRSGAPSAAKTIYGSVSGDNGAPADGAIVYVKLDGAGEMSSLVKNSGSWAVPLSNARTPDGSGYAPVTDENKITLTVQGPQPTQSAELTATVKDAQPVPAISLGTDGGKMVAQTDSAAKVGGAPQISTSSAARQTPSPSPASKIGTDPAESTGKGTGTLPPVSLASPTPSPSAAIAPATKASPSPTTKASPVPVKSSPSPSPTINPASETGGTDPFDTDDENYTTPPADNDTAPSADDIFGTGGAIITPSPSPTTKSKSQRLLADATLAMASPSPIPYGSGNPYPAASPSPSPSPAYVPATGSGGLAATDSPRVSIPSTEGGIPTSGSVGSTLALVIGGLFFLIAGVWSFWIANQLNEAEVQA